VLRLLQAGAGLAFLWMGGVASAQLQLITRPVPSPQAVERGQKAFVANCGFCHGATAKGGESGPDLVRSVLVLDDEAGDKIGPVILKGRPDKGMPAFALPADQVSDIAAFLRARTQAAINRREYKIPNLLTGDAKAGEAYFNGAGKCNSCHSPSADLAGIGGKYAPEQLETRFLYPRGPQPKPSQVTVTLRGGQTYSGELVNLDDFNVGLRDSDGYYHSFARETAKVDVRDPYAAHADLLRKYTDADMHNLLAYLVTLQ
jgi:cytochrome c oxidase cbb3-type subunit 3